MGLINNNNDKNISDNTTVTTSISKFLTMCILLFGFGGSITTIQLNTQHKIEQLYVQSKYDNNVLLEKLEGIERKQDIYAFKKGVEDALIYLNNMRAATNTYDEIVLRTQLRDFLNKN